MGIIYTIFSSEISIMYRGCKSKYLVSAVILNVAVSSLILSFPASAQKVIEDGTLPTRATTRDNRNFIIDGNVNNVNRFQGNLFHSFKEFSIPKAGSAIFNNSPDVINIINRVTGSSISDINGLIKANGNANVFLINPNGIVFGENAALDIGGSFFGSTATSINFADNISFSAIDKTASPLLTISTPIGLQMGNSPKAILVKGKGHAIDRDSSFNSLNRNNNPLGLQVNSGKSLALVGGEITISGGAITSNGGNIQLAAIGNHNRSVNVNINQENLVGYSEINNFADIILSQKALLDSSGLMAGNIWLQGRNVSITDGSFAIINNQGNNSAGNIQIDASETVTISGTTAAGFSSNLRQEVTNLGSGGDIKINAKNLIINQGARIINTTFAEGNSGNINLNIAEFLQNTGFAPSTKRNGSISASTYASGNTGNVNISAKQIEVTDGANISAGSFGAGSGGNLTINSQDYVEVGGADINLVPSSIAVSATSKAETSKAGNLEINTSKLIVRDGGRVAASTYGGGNAGKVVINASKSVEVRGEITQNNSSSRINSNTQKAPRIFQILFNSPSSPTGNAGDLTVNTPNLFVTDGAEITVANQGTGNAGELQINAESILLNKSGNINAATLSGGGGNINLNLEEYLFLRRNSKINTQATGSGDGGNIIVNSPVIAGFENSDIIANAIDGKGGNIEINTKGIFGLNSTQELTQDSDISASSKFGVDGIVEIKNLEIDSNSGLTILPANVIQPNQKVAEGCAAFAGNYFVFTGKGGLPTSPTAILRSQTLWHDLGDSKKIVGSKIKHIETFKDDSKKIVEATGWVVDDKGNIEFVAAQNVNITEFWRSKVNCSGYTAKRPV